MSVISESLRRDLVDGMQVGEGLILRALTVLDLDSMMDLLRGTWAELDASSELEFLLPRGPEQQVPVLGSEPGEIFGADGMTVGVVAEHGRGPVVATATMALRGDMYPATSDTIHNVWQPREKAAYMRTLTVHPEYRRRGLATATLRLRVRTAEAIGRVCVGGVEIRNHSSRLMFLAAGFVAADMQIKPRYPGRFYFCMVDRPEPGGRFGLDEDTPPSRFDLRTEASKCAEALQNGWVGVRGDEHHLEVRRLAENLQPGAGPW